MNKIKIHVKKNDIVQVITGKDAGKKGKILNVDLNKGRVIVEGINIVKKHMKPTQSSPQGGIVEQEAAIASSNVMIYCEKCKEPVRINKKFLTDGKKVRVCYQCGEQFDK
ncbi:MAG: 50S ribosomal protein L24 [Clostridia bacterium]|nr:50S ribosomal protein L24 [Clostridia bacterium]MDD4047360.1 50S ribosomal protein L24 [Clostridia bacterium]